MSLTPLETDLNLERLFLGIPVYALFKKEIDAFSAHYQTANPEWKWVNLKNAHITLHFFGDLPVSQKAGLIENFKNVLKTIPPFELSLKDIGCFKEAKNASPKVVWLAINPKTFLKLRALHEKVIRSLETMGYSNLGQTSKYCPHVTLFRLNREMAENFNAESLSFRETPIRTVREVILYRSQLTPDGAIYTQDYVFSLG